MHDEICKNKVEIMQVFKQNVDLINAKWHCVLLMHVDVMCLINKDRPFGT